MEMEINAELMDFSMYSIWDAYYIILYSAHRESIDGKVNNEVIEPKYTTGSSFRFGFFLLPKPSLSTLSSLTYHE